MDRNVTPVEVDALIGALKKRFRDRGITYESAARALGVSPATVKRALNGRDVSLSRLLELARLGDVKLSELIDEAGLRDGRETTYFDERQDALFVRYPHVATYFFALADGSSPAELARKYGLRASTTRKYLSLLKKSALIEISDSGTVSLAIRTPFGFARGKSPYLKALSARLITQFTKRMLAKYDHPDKDMMLLRNLSLDGPSYEHMKKDFLAVFQRYAVLSDVPSKRRRASTVDAFAMVMMDVWTPPVDAPFNF